MSRHHTSGPCHRCGRAGHLARECTLHVCFRCNGRGHMAWECVEGVTCSRCGEKGHLQRNCKNVSCHKCGRKGHISKFCNDPFVKGVVVERDERHQAILKSRIAFSQGSGKDWLASPAKAVSNSSGKQKTAPGPWDGLGDRGQDRTILETQASSVGGATGKIGTKQSQGGMLGNVKILTLKRKIYPEAEMDGAKRLNLQNCSELETETGGNPLKTSPSKDTSEVDEPPQWNGLLGYSSEDSRDDCHSSSDGDCEEQSCKFREKGRLKLKPIMWEMKSSGIQPCGDERNDPAIGLQSSVEWKPARVDERCDSAFGLQIGVDRESLSGASPNFICQVSFEDVSQQAIHLKSDGT